MEFGGPSFLKLFISC